MKALDEGSRLSIGFGVEPLMRMSVARKKVLESQHVAVVRRPMITGPPPPVSINPTRRRMSARMMRSPSSASAMSSERSLSGAMTSASTLLFGMGVDQGGPAGELRKLAHEGAGTMADDKRTMPAPVPLGDVDVAAQDDDQARGDASGLGKRISRFVTICSPRTAARARSRADPARETFGLDALR